MTDICLRDAYRLEKDVEKYINGTLPLPPRDEKIDWDSIFTEN